MNSAFQLEIKHIIDMKMVYELQYIHTNDNKEETMSNTAYHMDPKEIAANFY